MAAARTAATKDGVNSQGSERENVTCLAEILWFNPNALTKRETSGSESMVSVFPSISNVLMTPRASSTHAPERPL